MTSSRAREIGKWALAVLGLSQMASNEEAAAKTSLQLALDRGLKGPLLAPVHKALRN